MSLAHLFVPIGIAILAKEYHFNEECIHHYFVSPEGTQDKRLYSNGGQSGKNINSEHNDLQFSAPIYQQLVDWFAMKHGLYIQVNYNTTQHLCWWMILLSDGSGRLNPNSDEEKFSINDTGHNKCLISAFKYAFSLINK